MSRAHFYFSPLLVQGVCCSKLPLSDPLLFPLRRDHPSEEGAHTSGFKMAIESAPNIPEEANASKAEVHDSVDVVDDPSREVSKKRQSLSDLFTIVSDSFPPLLKIFLQVSC